MHIVVHDGCLQHEPQELVCQLTTLHTHTPANWFGCSRNLPYNFITMASVDASDQTWQAWAGEQQVCDQQRPHNSWEKKLKQMM